MDHDDDRIARLERRVADLERALGPAAERAPAQDWVEDAGEEIAVTGAPAATGPPILERETPHAPPPQRAGSAFDLESLLTARALAWVGGGVLLLGLAFFLAIAIDRGWINETARVVLALLFSGGLLASAVLLRNQYGRLEAGLVAAGAGIAGLFFTDLAAGPLYDLVPDGVTVAVAILIAAAAVLLAIAWSAEPIAAIGLAGVMLAAPVIVSEIRLSGLTVVAVALAAAAVLMVGRGWKWLMLACLAFSLPQATYWIAQHSDLHAQALLLTAGFWGLSVAAALAYELRRRDDDLDATTAMVLLGATSFALTGLLIAVDGKTIGLERDGLAVAGFGLLYVGGAVALWLAGRSELLAGERRDLRSLIGAVGLAVIALAMFILFKHHTLVTALAVEAALLAWLGRELGEERLTFASIAYLAASLVYLLTVEATPALLFDNSESPGIQIISVAAAAAAAAILALCTDARIRQLAGWVSGGLLVYAASLAIVAILSSPHTELFGETNVSFQRAQTVVSIFWGATGFGLLVVGLRRQLPSLRTAGFVLLGVALAKAFLFDLSSLTAFARALSFLGLGTLLLIAAVVHQRLSRPAETAPNRKEPPPAPRAR
jgi:uncharacterized membrane protein